MTNSKSLTTLSTLTEKELNKISKSDLISSINQWGFQVKHNNNEVTKAKDKLEIQSKDERAAKEIMIGYLGIEIDRNEYNPYTEIDKLSLTELLGKLMVKAARY